MRIYQKDLEAVAARLNKLIGIEEKVKYNTVGGFIIDHAYGGVSLHKIENGHGAVSDVFRCGHITKKELYYRINAFIDGIEYERK